MSGYTGQHIKAEPYISGPETERLPAAHSVEEARLLAIKNPSRVTRQLLIGAAGLDISVEPIKSAFSDQSDRLPARLRASLLEAAQELSEDDMRTLQAVAGMAVPNTLDPDYDLKHPMVLHGTNEDFYDERLGNGG
jgi:hypothetical protein